MTRLSVRRLELSYGDTSVLDGVDLEVADGECLALSGPSGSGKTTLLRVIAGLVQPAAGDIRFDGESVVGRPAEQRGAVMVFQDHMLFPFRTVGENVAYGLRIRKVARAERDARVEHALESVRLADYSHRWPDELSGGQRQRVALARALVVRPRLLLLDEPMSNLDPDLRHEVGEAIVATQREVGITTVLVTHDRCDAAAVSDRMAVLDGGRIREDGATAGGDGGSKRL